MNTIVRNKAGKERVSGGAVVILYKMVKDDDA